MSHVATAVDSDTWWLEISVMVCFALGALLLKGDRFHSERPLPMKMSRKTADEARSTLCKRIEDDASSGNSDVAVALWRAAKTYTPSPSSTLREVMQALLTTVDASAAVNEVLDHIVLHESCRSPTVAAALIGGAASAGSTQAMTELLWAFQHRVPIALTSEVQDSLLAGYESLNDMTQVIASLEAIRCSGQTVTMRGHSVAMRGFLRHGLLDEALAQALEMTRRDFVVPRQAVTEIFILACSAGRPEAVLDQLRSRVDLTVDAVEVLIQHCARNKDRDLAERVRQFACAKHVPFTLDARVAMRKLGIILTDEACSN